MFIPVVSAWPQRSAALSRQRPGVAAGPRERWAHAPVQDIVATRDRYVRPALTEDLSRWVARLWRRQIEVHHWLPLSHPQRMAAMACEFVDHLDGTAASPALESARVDPEAAKIS